MTAKFCGPAIVCIVTGAPFADEHHIYTQKARKDLVEAKWNKIPLTHMLHEMAHKKGMTYMADTYFAVRQWLLCQGWDYDCNRKKWFHPGAVQERQVKCLS